MPDAGWAPASHPPGSQAPLEAAPHHSTGEAWRPPRIGERPPHHRHGARAVPLEVVAQHAHESPALIADRTPPVSIALKLRSALGVLAPVILGSDTPTSIGQIQSRHEPVAVVGECPPRQRFGQAGSDEKKPEPGLAWRLDSAAHGIERGAQHALPQVAHGRHLCAEVVKLGESVAWMDHVLGRRDEIVVRPCLPGLAPRANRMLDRDAVLRHRPCRLSQLQPVSDDPAGARFSSWTSRGDMQSRPVRPLRQGNSVQGQRGLMAEELPWLQSRRVLTAQGTQIGWAFECGVRADAVERCSQVSAAQSRARDSERGRVIDAEMRSEAAGKFRAVWHPVILGDCHTPRMPEPR